MFKGPSIVVLMSAALLAACAGETPPQQPSAATATTTADARAPRATDHWAPFAEAGMRLLVRVCRPESDAPARLVVINHGSPASSAQRPSLAPSACGREAVKWFVDRGYVVALPIRRGYGQTGGPWAENYGPCTNANFGRAGLESARDIAAVLGYLRGLDYIAPSKAIVVGQSAGGWATLAVASRDPADVGLYVNFAGGRGGWAYGQPHSNCSPSHLPRDAGVYGQTARAPTLWVYTANDTFFNPDLVGQMHAAFRQAGGQAELHQLPAWGRDGHGFFFGDGASRIWGPIVERFLASNAARLD